jgi:hypothetical protein
MGRNKQQLVLSQRPRVRARALANPNESHRIPLRADYALATAVIALWIAYLPLINAEVMSHLNVVPQHLTSTQIIDRTHKGDRVAGIKFEDRRNAIGNNRASRAMRRVERIPYACEATFSRLVKTGNFSVRCIA